MTASPLSEPRTASSVLRFFHPVLKSSALRREPVQVKVANEAFALFRDKTGRACAVEDRCPHRFAPLSAGHVRPDGRIACPFHGWHFDGNGQGVSPSQPSLKQCNVRALRVEERSGYVWLGDAKADPAQIDAVCGEPAGFEFAGSYDVRIEAAVEHVLDIFSDAEHPPWVHGRLAWSENDLDALAYADQRKSDRSLVQTSGPQRPSVMARALGIRKNDRFNNHWVTSFNPVRAQFHVFWTSPDGQSERKLSTKTTLCMVPESERVTRLVAFVHTRLTGRAVRWVHPVLKRLTVIASKAEVGDDARFIHCLKDVPLTTQGMRLGRMDGVIRHNRRLLNRLYFQRSALPISRLDPIALAAPTQAPRQELDPRSEERALA